MRNSKLCFIGAGVHASANILPAAVEAGAVIQAIATRSLERSKAALQRFGSNGTPYNDYHSMLKEEDCDGVVIVAQPYDQTLLVLDCIQAGKNVFVDKPLGWNTAQATQIADAAEKAGVVLMVGFMKRFAPCYMMLKERLMDGSLGQARSFQAKFVVDSTPFCQDEEHYMKLAAIHIVDLMRFLFGEVAELSGYSNSHYEFISNSISLKFENGIVGSVYLSGMSAWSKESESLLVTFDQGYVKADDIETVSVHQSQASNASWKSLVEQNTVFTHSSSTMSGGVKDLYLRGFVGEIAHFMRCCEEGITPLSNGRDNVSTMSLCDRIISMLTDTKD